MKITATTLLKALNVLAWVIFVLLCVKTGAILVSFMVSLFVNPAAAGDLYKGFDLSSLLAYGKGEYIFFVSAIILIWALKAFLFYWIIRISRNSQVRQPFQENTYRWIGYTGWIALLIGLLLHFFHFYSHQLEHRGIVIHRMRDLLDGGPEFMLMAALAFVLSQVFKRGLEIQTENELTV